MPDVLIMKTGGPKLNLIVYDYQSGLGYWSKIINELTILSYEDSTLHYVH